MLQELYNYALQQNLTTRTGFKPKRIKAYVCFDQQGNFLGIDAGPDRETPCPDLGSGANSDSKCNFPVEKALITLPFAEKKGAKPDFQKPKKREYYLRLLEQVESAVPQCAILRAALMSFDTAEAIAAALLQRKIKSGDLIGYKVDGFALESCPALQDWWSATRESAPKKGNLQRCLITGELTVPLATVTKVSGLRAVGGHASGDALFGFDKDAFCSYGCKQGENAPVSEEAMTIVNAALNALIEKGTTLGGARWLHWYKSALPQEMEDPFADVFSNGSDNADDDTEDDAEDDDADDARALDAEAQKRAHDLLRSPWTGERASTLQNEYYLLALSGAGGRMMVRLWQQGSMEELQQHLNLWWDQLDLIAPSGKSYALRPRLGQLCFRLLKPVKGSNKNKRSERIEDLEPLADKPVKSNDKSDPKELERSKKELSSLVPQLVFAIINGTPLPAPVAAKALRNIQSTILDAEENQNKESLAYQLLKVWLCRLPNAPKGESAMKAELNPNYSDVAYHCGRLMAVYAAIQRSAMGDVNVTVVQRYYAAASRTPQLVIGRLSSLSQYHLAKLDSPGLARYFENMLDDIAKSIPHPLPATLDMKGQAEFALGYYHQRAEMRKQRQAKPEAEATDE